MGGRRLARSRTNSSPADMSGSSCTSSMTRQTSTGATSRERIEDPLDVAAPPWSGPEGRQDRRRQATSVLVAGFTRDPAVHSPW